MAATQQLIVRNLGLQAYRPVWQAMTAFTDNRQPNTVDELWLVQHPPVFTQGQAGKAEHILAAGDIPVVQVDRGGQVTYHGPGQQVIYVLLDIRRKGLGVRQLVTCIEQAIIDTLAELGIVARARADAPGVYVGDAKIAALGLRIRRGCSFHGLALNIAMDLAPFQRINPCGYANMAVTQVQDFVAQPSMAAIARCLVEALARHTQYGEIVSGDNSCASQALTLHHDVGGDTSSYLQGLDCL